MKKLTFALLFTAFILSGCVTPVQLNLGPNQRASLTDLSEDGGNQFSVFDERTNADRAGSKSEGIIWLGDKELDPLPAVAVARELRRALENKLEASHLADIKTAKLKTFDVAVQWRDLRKQGLPTGMPGMLAFDYLVRGALQTGTQMTFVLTVRVELEVEGAAYKAEVATLHPSDSGPIQLQGLVRKANQQIAEKISAKYQEDLGGRK